MKIFKYPLKVTQTQVVQMPAGAELLHVAEQHHEIIVWAKVDDTARPVGRRIDGVVTGGEAPQSYPHIGTVLLHDGSFVFHFFDGGEA